MGASGEILSPSRTSRTVSREQPSARAISRSPRPSDSRRRHRGNRCNLNIGGPLLRLFWRRKQRPAGGPQLRKSGGPELRKSGGPQPRKLGGPQQRKSCTRSLTARPQISPGIAHPLSRFCLSDLRSVVPCKYRALTFPAVSPQRVASSASCSSGQRFARSFLPTPPRDDAVAALLTFPLAGYVKVFHLQVDAPCRAHWDCSALRASSLRGRRRKDRRRSTWPTAKLSNPTFGLSRARVSTVWRWMPKGSIWRPDTIGGREGLEPSTSAL